MTLRFFLRFLFMHKKIITNRQNFVGDSFSKKVQRHVLRLDVLFQTKEKTWFRSQKRELFRKQQLRKTKNNFSKRFFVVLSFFKQFSLCFVESD